MKNQQKDDYINEMMVLSKYREILFVIFNIKYFIDKNWPTRIRFKWKRAVNQRTKCKNLVISRKNFHLYKQNLNLILSQDHENTLSEKLNLLESSNLELKVILEEKELEFKSSLAKAIDEANVLDNRLSDCKFY